MSDALKFLVTPVVLLLIPLVWARVEPSFTKSSRLRRRISDHQALAEKLPPDSDAATNLQGEIDRQVNELVNYWADRRSKASNAKKGQPVTERWSVVFNVLTFAAAVAIGALASILSH